MIILVNALINTCVFMCFDLIANFPHSKMQIKENYITLHFRYMLKLLKILARFVEQ